MLNLKGTNGHTSEIINDVIYATYNIDGIYGKANLLMQARARIESANWAEMIEEYSNIRKVQQDFLKYLSTINKFLKTVKWFSRYNEWGDEIVYIKLYKIERKEK